MAALGLADLEEYKDWCRDNGFPVSLEKSRAECQEELRLFKRQQAWVKELSRIHRNPRKLIIKACKNEIDADRITRPIWANFVKRIQRSKPDAESRASLNTLLEKVMDEGNFLTESVTYGDRTYPYIDALIRLNSRRGQWIRPLGDWRASSHNLRRQFSSLLRHLLAEYPVPGFMDSAWFRWEKGSYRLRNWFILLGSGKNIRTAKTPIPLTKRMAHHFLDAPDDYSIENALRWGQVHALGGDRRLTEALLGTRLSDSFDHDEFWITVIRFLIDNPLLDRQHVGPVIDYLGHQKFDSREELIGPGQVEIIPPPHPNLIMRGRTPDSLLRQIDRWHRRLGRSEAAKAVYFRKSGIHAFERKTGRDKKTIWTIRELLSGQALTQEGRAMHHCVATYAGSCARGQCSIWAMERNSPEGLVKHQTVEVNHHGVIIESRGKYNRLPTVREFDMLRAWADQEGLTISRYVKTQ